MLRAGQLPDALLLLRARQLGLSVAGVIAAYATYNAAYAALAYPAGHLSDRLPRRVVYATGLVFFAAGYLGLAVIGRAWLVFPVLAVYGGFNACTDGVGKAWISTLLPAGAQGTGQGLYQGLTGAATLIAGVWAGLAWHGTGRLPLLVSGAIAALIAAGVLLSAARPRRWTPGHPSADPCRISWTASPLKLPEISTTLPANPWPTPTKLRSYEALKP